MSVPVADGKTPKRNVKLEFIASIELMHKQTGKTGGQDWWNSSEVPYFYTSEQKSPRRRHEKPKATNRTCDAVVFAPGSSAVSVPFILAICHCDGGVGPVHCVPQCTDLTRPNSVHSGLR